MGAVRVIVRGARAAPRTAGTCGPYQLVAGVRPETVARVLEITEPAASEGEVFPEIIDF